jgi:hypothetical protein
MVKFPQNNQRFSRRPSTYKELLYICDGDCNGVFYYTGTSYGVHPWMNPALIKKLVVSASSPPSRFTDPKALVSRNYQVGNCLFFHYSTVASQWIGMTVLQEGDLSYGA